MAEGILIVTGESSGELYGARLAKRLGELAPELEISGVGGRMMRQSGVKVIAGITGAFGLFEVLRHVSKLRLALGAVMRHLDVDKPSLVVLIDFPDFNFKVGREAKKRGIGVLYYVSPQVWAWRTGRVKKMKEFVDRIAVLLPFEKNFYDKEGLKCEFVGHPIMEEFDEPSEPGGFEHTGRPVIALLPGSRQSELKRHLPILVDSAGPLRGALPGRRFVLPVAPDIDREEFDEDFRKLQAQGVELLDGGLKGLTYEVLKTAEAALVASGTATLQTALSGAPQVVFYRVSPFTYFIGSRVIKLPHLSLVNIIAGSGLVPELLQDGASVKNIVHHMKEVVFNEEVRQAQLEGYRDIKQTFQGLRPTERVAGTVIGMLQEFRSVGGSA